MKDQVQVILVGTGGSMPPPDLYCQIKKCPICMSKDPCDDRVESAVLITAGDSRLLVDAGRGAPKRLAELYWGKRPGCKFEREPPISFVAVTHQHFDHWGGIEELVKMYCRDYQGKVCGKSQSCVEPLVLYTHKETRKKIQIAARALGKYAGPDLLTFIDWDSSKPSRTHKEIRLQGLPVEHSGLTGCLAFLVTTGTEESERKILVAGDVDPLDKWENRADAEKLKRVADGIDLLIIGIAWWKSKDLRRITAVKALEFIKNTQPKRTRLVHISHLTEMNHAQMVTELASLCTNPDIDVQIGYDGMEILL